MQRSLYIVCDDAGFGSVDRGIRFLAEQSGLPLCADYMIKQDGAIERLRAMSFVPNVSIGLHFELFDITDADRFHLGKQLERNGTSLGEQDDIRIQALREIPEQLAIFREAYGHEPAHIGTHGNFHTDAKRHVTEWWTELMQECFGEKMPPLQLAVPHVRHNMYSWNTESAARLPRTPEEFAEELRQFHEHAVVEFVLHPALPEPGDASLNMLFEADMRVRDVLSALEILQSHVIESSGFSLVSVSAL